MASDRDERVLRAAVIGAGRISGQHLRFLRDSRLAEVVAVCDRSPAMARYAAERFGVPQSFTDLARMLAEAKPDVAHVLTPAPTHPAIVADCLEAGAHVIVEKPIAPTHAEFERLWRLARQCDRRLIEDHNYRFNRPIVEMERLVRDGDLGEVCEVEVRLALAVRDPGSPYADGNLPHPSHRLPAGCLHEFITHLCYLALRFLPRVENVWAIWRNEGGGELFRFDDLDTIVIGGGVRARIRFSAWTRPDGFHVVVRGTRGWASTDLFQPHLLVSRPRGGRFSSVLNQWRHGRTLKRAARTNLIGKLLGWTPYEGLFTFLGRTYRALLDDAEPPVTFDDMDRTARLIDALVAEQGSRGAAA